MPTLDTNVLVRFIVQNDPSQFAAAKRLIKRRVAEGSTLFVPVTVVLELQWVLRSSFAFDKDDVLMTLSKLFSAADLSFESERAFEVALQLFRKGSADSRRPVSNRCGPSTRVPPRSMAPDFWPGLEWVWFPVQRDRRLWQRGGRFWPM